MYQTCKQPWFHGDISKAQAEKILRGYKEGYFLVRLSSTVSGCFTISRVTPNKSIHHHRVDYLGAQGFSTRSIVSKTIIKAPNKSLRSFINLLKEDMHLHNACPGSKYRVLFKVLVVTSEGGYDPDEDEQFFED